MIQRYLYDTTAYLALRDNLLAVAGLAAVLVFDSLSLAVTVVALALHLLHHTRANLDQLDLHERTQENETTTTRRKQLNTRYLDALPLATPAGLHRALLAAATLAARADDVLLDGKLGDLAVVHVFKRHRKLMHHVFAFALALLAPAASAKEHVEQPATHVVTALAASLLAATGA